jgi:hypothetical protein
MDLNDFKSSKFLKKEDVGEGIPVTIRLVKEENVAKEGAEHEMKPCLYFNEVEKPFVCNSTNAQIIAQITGINTDVEHGWVGKRIVLYTDPNVSFGGKLIGGIRVRAIREQKKDDLAF